MSWAVPAYVVRPILEWDPPTDLVVWAVRQEGITVKPDSNMVTVRGVVHQGTQYQHLPRGRPQSEAVTVAKHALVVHSFRSGAREHQPAAEALTKLGQLEHQQDGGETQSVRQGRW